MRQHVHLKQLIATSRPHTVLFAFLVTIIGFNFYQISTTSTWIITLTSLTFILITASIMTFNDFVDREHDKKKGKYFCSKNGKEIFSYWCKVTFLAFVLIFVIFFVDFFLSLFCLCIILGLGLLYSLIPNWYTVNNVIVAFCSGAPILCGMIYFKKINFPSICSFLIFFGIMIIREIVKDIEDREIDLGYKKTIPIINPSATMWVVLVFTVWIIISSIILFKYLTILIIPVIAGFGFVFWADDCLSFNSKKYLDILIIEIIFLLSII